MTTDPNTEFHQACLREAIRLSIENVERGNGGPFGAVVVREREIIGYGANAVTATNDPTAHAEIVAIRRAGIRLATYDLSGCVLYTSCEPCPMCLSATYWARIGAVYYAASQADAATVGFDDAFLYREIALSMWERSLPMTVIPECEEFARTAFSLWASDTNKTMY
jgi:tRNA(Arg) A34 adenosine deaminase TadA